MDNALASPIVDSVLLREAYRRILRIRLFEKRVREECLAGNVPGYNHISAGQEAVAVSVALNLSAGDYVTSTHRAHGHLLALSDDMSALALELFHRAGGLCGGKGGSMHICDVKAGFVGANGIVGASVPHAVGLGLAAKKLGTGGVAVSFFGDGAFNQGATLEAMNLAAVHSLPVLFVLEDNGYAESTSSSWATGGNNPVARAAGFGIHGERMDGVDFQLAHNIVTSAIQRVRSTGSPFFLHADVPLFYGHYVGDPEKYRAKGEARRERKERDCVASLRGQLLALGIVSESDLSDLEAAVQASVREAIEAALVTPLPGLDELTRNVVSS